MRDRKRKFFAVISPIALLALGHAAVSAAPSGAAEELRQVLLERVGDLDLLRVPATDAALPQPLRAGGGVDPDFAITEEKRYLGKMLFFDPVRTNNIKPEFGGVPAMAQTASCGSCHLAAAAGKAGVQMNLSLGGEGFGYRDPSDGTLVIRRRVRPGLVDILPTAIEQVVDGVVIRSGRFDAVDSVPRLSPAMVGFAFNNRLLLGGEAGEPHGPGKVNINPDGLPAGENLAEIAAGAHRMAGTQNDALQAVPAYVKLFQDAYPQEADRADASGDLDVLINDRTVSRAIAAFLRTVITRDTPWDRFLAGDTSALSKRQLEGGLLFARTTAEGGANCIACHSGPALNKALGDETGVGVEENFHNVGIGDHPLQALARSTLGNPDHRDRGRAGATGLAADAFKFRSLTLRQLRRGGHHTHAAIFRTVRRVVEYFNAGTPLDLDAAAAGTLSPLFTNPRGDGYPPGLGLRQPQITALVDFLENALYDNAFIREDSASPTRPFDPTIGDLSYSVNRPDLAALGARDRFMPSGLPPFNNDPLTRRDFGLELLDITDRINVRRSTDRPDVPGRAGARPQRARMERLILTNHTTEPIDTDLMVIIRGLPEGAVLMNASGVTETLPEPSLPYLRIFLPSGFIEAGGSVEVELRFSLPPAGRVDYEVILYTGQIAP